MHECSFSCEMLSLTCLLYILIYCLKDWVAALEGEDDQDGSDGALGDWAKLETMRSSHPMYFAKKLTEVIILYV